MKRAFGLDGVRAKKISNLTKVGGLNASFEEDWEDGTTIFYAWW